MREGLVPADSPQAGPLPAPTFASEQYAPAVSPPQNPLERPLAAIRRYKWLIAAVTVLASGLGVVGTRFIAPSYNVRATLWIAAETRAASSSAGPIRSIELLNSEAWVELLRSYRIIDAVVRKLALYLRVADPADRPLFQAFELANRFAPGTYELYITPKAKAWSIRNEAGVVLERGTTTDSIGRNVGLRWVLPSTAFNGDRERKVVFTVVTPREIAVQLNDGLKSRLAEGSNFLWLTYSSSDAKLAARTLNAWLEEYVKVAADLKKRNIVEFQKILGEQLRFAERATANAETEYQRFRVNTITLPTEGVPLAAGTQGPGGGDPALNSYFEQKIEYDNLRNDRMALEQSIAKASTASAPYEGIQLIPSVAQSQGAQPLRAAFDALYTQQASLRVQRQTFTDDYPTVKELIASITILQKQTIPELANQLLEQLRSREQDYERRLSSASKELQAIPPRTIEERRLSRQVTVSEGLYTNLQNRYAEARLAEASTTPDVSILDTAVAPLRPTTNTAPRILLMAVAGGVGVALALALLLDLVDRRLRYSEQATSELGLLIAGAVPRVPKGGINAKSSEQVLQFVESFRSLRMHVMHSSPGQRIALAVTSAAPGDGKSLVSANLALSFAEAGLKTILIDGDTRRGSLHKMFALTGAGGLTDFLVGSVNASQVVRATTHANLSFVSCGRRHPRSPELLASAHLKAFVQYLSQSFDVVIFDTPPLAAGIDGFAISAAAGSILMVLRIGETERRLASAKLAVLDRLPVQVLGAVLNSVPQTSEFQYYSYSSGYSIDTGDPELVSSATE